MEEIYKNEEEFFKANEYSLIKDGSTYTPPLYYQSLDDAFGNYFNTFKNNKNSYHFLADSFYFGYKPDNLQFCNIDSTVFTILGFHRFFELLLKDILRQINPFLAVKFPDKEKDAIRFYNKELDPDKIETIEFKKAFERFKEALTYSEKNPSNMEYSIANKFSFLKLEESLIYSI